ncbi:MAG: preprotein translocase subunit SecA [Acidobacteria bacterium]|nr:MAG: preprotein translocase subunit SecA [Acidobacteriota bacterium]
MLKAISKVFGNKNSRELKKLQPLVNKINDLEDSIKALSDEELKEQTVQFRERLNQGETLDDLLPEAFATVREAAIRVLGMRPFDVQLLGGIALAKGTIAEMKTGEGKTLTATLPVYLNALEGKGAHVITVNDYLASRDSEWMGKLYKWLGLSVGLIVHGLSDEERKRAYQCDITYGTNNEFGFDYLRDNMKFTTGSFVQRGFNYAIVDEVDSVLIDEARTPLIISGPSEDKIGKYYDANEVIKKLKRDLHFTVDEKDSHALLNEEGIREAEKILRISNLYDPSNIEILHCMEQSLKAHYLFKRDVDYLVGDSKEGGKEVIIIDQQTGRQMPGRRYSDGLHQALEAKEYVKIQQQSQTLATVTFQNFFRMYKKLSGMTGTAETEAAEFLNIYGLEVLVIPTNRPNRRVDHHDQIYKSTAEKFAAIIQEIETLHQKGRPILVGTIAIETSEELSEKLRKRGIKHIVLNAKYHAMESEIVSQAGRLNAVTVATNMAGRGTDIILGGNAEMLAKTEVKNNPDRDYNQVLAKYQAVCEKEKEQVLALGGLAILGTERHESRRIDNQLRGRSGRQGDPGSTRFFLSLEDTLMKHFGNPRMQGLMKRSMEEGKPIEHGMVNKAIERAQKSVEGRNFEIRKHLLDYDDVMNKQRNTFYALRRDLLNGSPRDYLFDRTTAIVDYQINAFLETKVGFNKDNQKKFQDILFGQFNYKAESELPFEKPEALKEQIIRDLKEKYCEKWDVLELPANKVTDHERFILLYLIDQQWKDHMRNMDSLKEGISLHGYAQKDPLIEYKKQSFEMFNELLDRCDEEATKTLIFMQPQIGGESINRMKSQRKEEAKAMKMASRDGDSKPKTVRRNQPKIGRNSPCPCGSGKKYKQCCGRK